MPTHLHWWSAPALLLAAFYLFMAGQNLLATDPPRPGIALALVAFTALLPTALLIRTHHRHISTALLVVGVLPGLAAWWTLVTPLAALATVTGALTGHEPDTATEPHTHEA